MAHEDIDTVGYIGTWEQWCDYLELPDGPGPDLYKQFKTDFEKDGEIAMSFDQWIAKMLIDCLSEADEDDIATKSNLEE